MALSSIQVPNGITLLAVNLSSFSKTVTLPVIATNPGRMLIFKDIFGNASVSTLRLSTSGTDIIERSNATSTILSTSYGAWTFLNDGINKWFLANSYLNSLIINRTSVFNFTTITAGNFNIAGNTTFVGNEARLTTNGTSLAGSIYYNQKLNIQSFNTTFTMRFEQTQADGGTFCIQNASSNALGTSGSGIGYGGIGTSIAIRFDTYSSSTGGVFSTDVLSNGTISSDAGASGNLNSVLGLSAGGTWNFRVSVTYTNPNLSYTITNITNGSNYTYNTSLNIPAIVGSSNAWVGFTGGTGGAAELQYLSAWSF